jgi:hypothetical protein
MGSTAIDRSLPFPFSIGRVPLYADIIVGLFFANIALTSGPEIILKSTLGVGSEPVGRSIALVALGLLALPWRVWSLLLHFIMHPTKTLNLSRIVGLLLAQGALMGIGILMFMFLPDYVMKGLLIIMAVIMVLVAILAMVLSLREVVLYLMDRLTLRRTDILRNPTSWAVIYTALDSFRTGWGQARYMEAIRLGRVRVAGEVLGRPELRGPSAGQQEAKLRQYVLDLDD